VAANQLRIDGLAELRRALLALPPALVHEAGVIVHAQAEAMMREVAAGYARHVHTGNLLNHLRLELGQDQVSASARVKNTAKHAYIFENGTAPRHHASGKSTGRMPEGRVFIPIAIQRRRIMYAALIDLVERSGLHVSGAAG
jgi:hypothetical protein